MVVEVSVWFCQKPQYAAKCMHVPEKSQGRMLGDGHSPHSSAGERGTGVSRVVGRIGYAAQGLGSRAFEAVLRHRATIPASKRLFIPI